jgi:hypothetical protein
MMKIFSLLLAFFVVAEARKMQTPASLTRVIQVRGGGELGPLNVDLAMQLSKAAATAYVAGSASKYIAASTGGSSTQVRN